MTKKKQTQPSISQGESEQVQAMLARYHQIAAQLRASADEQQARAALTEINNMPAGAQIAFLKALARETRIDAADVLEALHAFGTLKEARKEARRSLIRLEGAKIYPAWEAPLVVPAPPEEDSLQSTSFPPRFFKGLVTDSRESGEIQLILCWELGEDYREVRMLGFLLEFWHDGIKDFFTSPETKRSFANLLPQVMAHLGDVKLKECSLAEGIALLEEAKTVNARHGTKPHRDYTRHLALINQLIPESLVLQVRNEIQSREEHEEEPDLSELAPQDIVVNFVESWVEGEPGIAYQLLSQDSPLREGLSRDEWIERRDEWAEKFDPADIRPALLHTREIPKSKIWLPASMSKKSSATTQEVEAGWSVEFEEMLLHDSDKLPELPTPVTTYAETKRHWFWASFTLVQENGAWHIQSITDEYVKAQGLSAEALRKHLDELDRHAEKAARQQTPEQIEQMTDTEQEQFIEDTLLPMQQALYYADTLVRKEPLDRSVYIEAAGRARVLGQYERSLAHLQALLERFPEEHVLLYRRIAETQQRLAARCAEEDDEEREALYLDQAEKSFQAALALEENMDARISLAEVLLEKDERLDEAKSHLLQAKQAVSEPDEEAHIEMHLGEIALKQEQPELALSHFRRVVELRPADDEYWNALGEVQQELEHFSEAESSYKRAIELNPYNAEYYSSLGLLYKGMDQNQRALQALKDGLAVNPESVELHLYLAAAYGSMDDFRQAEDLLAQAEHLDPGSELVDSYRRMLALSKLSQTRSPQKPLKLTGPKKKKRH